MLDVGEDRGALVVYTSEAREGEEIEIRPHDGEWLGLHTAVRARHMGEIVRYAGVFGSLSAGLYDVRIRHDHASHVHGPHVHGPYVHGSESDVDSGMLTVTVKPGSVVETTL
jgi:hypothetical protein